MKSTAMAAALSMMALALLHGPAGAQSLESLLAGSEVYRNQGYGSSQVRNERLSLAADGTFTGDAMIERSLSWTSFTEELSVSGRWRVAGDRLCLAEARDGRAAESCYALARVGGNDPYVEFRGTEIGTGLPLQFMVAPGG